MEMVFRWTQIEADFQRHYSIKDPGIITWRRFMLLLVNLPVDDSSFYAPFYNAAQEGTTYKSDIGNEPNKGWWKEELDKRRGRNKPRQRIGLEQFVKESRNQGTKK